MPLDTFCEVFYEERYREVYLKSVIVTFSEIFSGTEYKMRIRGALTQNAFSRKVFPESVSEMRWRGKCFRALLMREKVMRNALMEAAFSKRAPGNRAGNPPEKGHVLDNRAGLAGKLRVYA